jgi:DnaJ-class molecular chaperone
VTSAEPSLDRLWSTCPTCWGQRRIFRYEDGVTMGPFTCPECLGLGDITRVTPDEKKAA